MVKRFIIFMWGLGLIVGLMLSGIWSAAFADAQLHVEITAVSDGDSLRAGKLRLRLFGVDAPEGKQLCSTASGQSYACGQQAADWLRTNAGPGETLTCAVLDVDRYRRLIVRCKNNGMDINHALVRAGWALAYTRYSKAYVEAEQQARADQAGLWQGPFVRPEDWRRQQRQMQK